MTNLLYAEINIVGAVLLLLLLNNMNKSGSRDIPTDQKIFNACLLMNILIFLFDTGMWLTDGNPYPMLRTVNYVMTTLYYISNPLICFLWLLYTDYKIYESRSGLLKRARFYAIPVVVNSVLSLASPFTEWLFIIDKGNHYMRGPLFPVMALASLIYLAVSFVISLVDVHRNSWAENERVYMHLVIFPIGVIVASIIQIMFFGISIIWVTTMLALASIYINIQNGEISTDHLTGLYNRRRLKQHINRKIKLNNENNLLFAIMLDLDDFKCINDQLGHLMGDDALVKMASILRQARKGSDDFIARIGGDEFLIVGERVDPIEINQLIEKINSIALTYNQNHQLKYTLMPSMGYSVFAKGDTLDSFLAAADKEMYRNKQERKLKRSEYNYIDELSEYV
ncbi:MAG: GGDEF domain-containing protein [Eubacteriales bacterium]|nr:GGDEF domain-containing protein [Eubacteriales bacterium]